MQLPSSKALLAALLWEDGVVTAVPPGTPKTMTNKNVAGVVSIAVGDRWWRVGDEFVEGVSDGQLRELLAAEGRKRRMSGFRRFSATVKRRRRRKTGSEGGTLAHQQFEL